MDVTGTMTAPPPVPAKSQGRDTSQVARQTVSIRTVTTPSTMPVTTGSGATVFVGLGAPAGDSAPAACRRRVPEVQTRNGHAKQSSSESQSQQQQQLQLQLQLQQPSQQQQQQAAHVVKIKINPDSDKNGRVISTVRLTLDEKVDHEIENGIILPCEHSGNRDGCKVVSATNLVNEEHCTSGGGEGCVRISVVGNGPRSAENRNEKDMVHRGSPDTLNSSNSLNRSNNNNTCFYYNNYQSSLTGMVMSSGQCSPSDTLDSGTCSDLDGTPPPLPKKKNNNKVILGTGQHNRTGSLTSSGAEVDSDDNESNISCDSLNGVDLNGQIIPRKVNGTVTNGDLQAKAVELEVNGDRTTGITEEIVNLDRLELSNNDKEDTVDKLEEPEVQPITGKASESVESSLLKTSTPTRVRSPDSSSDQNGRLAPVVKECTYEERKQERIDQQEIISETSEGSVNPLTGKKYLYEYDRYYKFHMNELKGNNKDTGRGLVLGDNETDECFAGYKILDKEAIRSAKGTVRGVKNRVRAGIATFLQKPSSQAYIKKELGKVVVYTTTSGIVRKTFYNCKKVKQILRTHMVKYDELDLFGDAELQAELRERLGSTVIQLPQLFIDGQHIGGFDTVERLNESGKLRDMLKPYQSEDACTVCLFCGGYQWQLCPVCNGSKRSVHRNDFTAEFVALKCARCDVNGLIRCPHC